jgi:tetratricopeptide (TPR) repeat protein
MSTSTPSASRLNRLLTFIEQDGGNLALRKDAISEALGVGHLSIARELVEIGLQAHPGQPALLALSGSVHLHGQRYVEAEQALSAALARGIEAAEVRYNLGFALFMQRRFADSLAVLAESAKWDTVSIALTLRARCLHHLGRPDEAIADCKAHLAMAPADADTHGLLGLLLYEQSQFEGAQGHIDTALRLNPKQLDAMLARASLQSDSQQYDAARGSFYTLLQVYPDCGRAWLGLGLIKLLHMQVEAARDDVGLAARHMPEHIGTWHVLAWIQIMRGDVIAAELAFNRALAVDRNFGESHGGAAVIAALQGREADARLSIKRALKLAPQSMSARYAQMMLLRRRGQHEEAQAVLDTFLASPVARSDMQYRDLVTAHMRYLRTTGAHHSDPLRRH